MNEFQYKNLKRLTEIVFPRVLKKAEAGQVNLNQWCETLSRKTPCNTIACVLGWAALDHVFNRRGLRLSRSHTPYFAADGARHYIARKHNVGYDAAEEFFGLTHEQSTQLFGPLSVTSTSAITIQAIKMRIKTCKTLLRHAAKRMAIGKAA